MSAGAWRVEALTGATVDANSVRALVVREAAAAPPCSRRLRSGGARRPQPAPPRRSAANLRQNSGQEADKIRPQQIPQILQISSISQIQIHTDTSLHRYEQIQMRADKGHLKAKVFADTDVVWGLWKKWAFFCLFLPFFCILVPMCAHKKPTNATDAQQLGWGRGATDTTDTDIIRVRVGCRYPSDTDTKILFISR